MVGLFCFCLLFAYCLFGFDVGCLLISLIWLMFGLFNLWVFVCRCFGFVGVLCIYWFGLFWVVACLVGVCF